ncbi:MAG: GerMN domain-containing protein [Clostridia bacterium]
MKKILAIFLLAALSAGLSGCVFVTLTPVTQEGDVALPVPAIVAPPAPSGDSRAESTQRVTLYYVGADRQQLAPVTRTIRLTGEETLIEKTAQRLLDQALVPDLAPVAPEETRLISVEQSQGIAIVNLSVDALSMDAQALCWMKAALSSTLTALDGVEQVGVLIGGREESLLTLPAGMLRATNDTLTALWAQRLADEERFAANPVGARISREVALYFPTWLDNRLLPECRKVVFPSTDFAGTLIEELKKGPAVGDQAHAVLPRDARVSVKPEPTTLEDGRRVLMISFDENLYAQMERDSLSKVQLFSALAYTLCRTVPELDGLVVDVAGQIVTSLEDGLTRVTFENGVITPEAFTDVVASVATLYFADADGNLVSVKRAVSPQQATSPRALLEQLIAGPFVFDGGALPVFPDGATGADILGLRIEDQAVLVNLSSNLYRLCQQFSDVQERNFVYAIVNTLTALDGVDRVRFYVAGQVVETLGQSIYLKGELLANPGLVKG